MAECKHELKYLIGRADGIHCMACGAVLDKLPEKQEGETDGKLDDSQSAKPVEKRRRNRRSDSKSSTD